MIIFRNFFWVIFKRIRCILPPNLRFIKPYHLIWILPSIFISGIIRLINPLITIRLIDLDADWIGHFLLEPEIFLCEKELCLHRLNCRQYDTWYHTGFVSNDQIFKMYKRKLMIWPFPLGYFIYYYLHFFPNGERHRMEHGKQLRIVSWIDINNCLQFFPPHINFLPEEETRGKIL